VPANGWVDPGLLRFLFVYKGTKNLAMCAEKAPSGIKSLLKQLRIRLLIRKQRELTRADSQTTRANADRSCE
jgi:hypothetical protein